ncbi:MAG: hypothetical protein CM15mP106_7160 [Candidatus Neomarinimicrobiota bacterium]|nr:MAG: hypothetical protein CM15mP106_7160 [Candidatus Neomarinimicrobiota bacterium]
MDDTLYSVQNHWIWLETIPECLVRQVLWNGVREGLDDIYKNLRLESFNSKLL